MNTCGGMLATYLVMNTLQDIYFPVWVCEDFRRHIKADEAICWRQPSSIMGRVFVSSDAFKAFQACLKYSVAQTMRSLIWHA